MTLSQIYMKNGNVCVKTGATEMCTQGNGFANEQWHHVVYSNNGSVANLWLDGEIVNTITGGSGMSNSPERFCKTGLRPRSEPGISCTGSSMTCASSVTARMLRWSPCSNARLRWRSSTWTKRLPLPVLKTLPQAIGCWTAPGLARRLTCLDGWVIRSNSAARSSLRCARASFLPRRNPSAPRSGSIPTRVVNQPQTLWVLGKPDNSGPRYSIAMAPNSLKLCLLKATGNSTCAEDSAVGLIQNVWNHVTLTVDQPIPAYIIHGGHRDGAPVHQRLPGFGLCG